MRSSLDVAVAYLDAKTNPDAVLSANNSARSDLDETGPSLAGAALG